MKKQIVLYLAVLFAGGGVLQAREVRGRVAGSDGPLPGALVHWAGTTSGTVTDAQGRFTLSGIEGRDILVASFAGYRSDTLRVGDREIEFILQTQALETDAVVVTAAQRGNFVSTTGISKNRTDQLPGPDQDGLLQPGRELRE